MAYPNPYAGQQYYKQPGPQNPGKYPTTGVNYSRYGEQTQNGYVYDPYNDRYVPDPKAAQQYYENAGLIEKEPTPPGLGETLLPIAGVGAALAGGKYIGENLGTIGSEIKDVGAGLLGGGTPTTATEAGSMLPGVAASSGGAVPVGTAANGGTLMSDGSIAGGSSGIFNLGGGLAAGEVTAASAGAGLLGAYGAYDLLSNKKHGTSGALQGAASGAGIGTFIMPGLGTGIGAGVGALVGYFGNFGDVDAYKTEWKRKKELFDKGIISEAQLGPEPKSGRSKEELIAEAQATGGNVTFAGSRSEGDLTPVDIQGYATVLEEAHKRGIPPLQLAQMALQAGAVREHHGTIDVQWDKVGTAPAQAPAPTPQAPQPAPMAQPNTRVPAAPPAPLPTGDQALQQTNASMRSFAQPPPPPGLLSNQAPMPQMNRPLPLPAPTVQAPQPRPQLQPYAPAPQSAPPPGLLSNTQQLAPAPPPQPNAPAPQPVARPIAQPQNKTSPFDYDPDRDGPWVHLSPGILSVRS